MRQRRACIDCKPERNLGWLRAPLSPGARGLRMRVAAEVCALPRPKIGTWGSQDCEDWGQPKTVASRSSALSDYGTGWDCNRAHVAGVDVDDDDSQRPGIEFLVKALVEGEAFFDGSLIGRLFQAQADCKAGDLGAEGLLIATDEEDVELPCPDGVLLSQAEVRAGDGHAQSAAGGVGDHLGADRDVAGVNRIPDRLCEAFFERDGLSVVLVA